MSRPDQDLDVGADDLDRLRGLVREVTEEDSTRVEPPAALWDRIASAVEGDDDADATGPVPPGAGLAEDDRPAPDPVPSAVVTSLDDHRRRRRAGIVLAAAAAVVLLALAAGLLARDRTTTDDQQLVASTTLEALEPVGDATAAARLVREDDRYELILDTTAMAAAPTGQHYELWLLDPASSSAQPVSLGPMTGSTSVTVPQDVDVHDYDVVDISLQDDGQVEHSGHSLLRGTLA